MQPQLNTVEKLRQVWSILTPTDIASLEAEGTITSVVDATFNSRVRGNNYTGDAHVRRVYMFGAVHTEENEIATTVEWVKIDNLDPATLKQVALLLLGTEARILSKVVEQNGGVMPNVLDPVIPPAPPSTEPPTEPENPE